jgi:transposase orfA, IS3 family
LSLKSAVLGKEFLFLPQQYEPEFKQQIVRLHLEEGRTYRSLTAEYGISKASICKWCKKFSEECRQNALHNPTAQNDLELMKENRRLREELAEAKKENLFLKKAAAFFAKGID